MFPDDIGALKNCVEDVNENNENEFKITYSDYYFLLFVIFILLLARLI